MNPCRLCKSLRFTKIDIFSCKGTGLSSTVTARTLATEGGPVQQAALLRNFRADSIGKFTDHHTNNDDLMELQSRTVKQFERSLQWTTQKRKKNGQSWVKVLVAFAA